MCWKHFVEKLLPLTQHGYLQQIPKFGVRFYKNMVKSVCYFTGIPHKFYSPTL